MLVPAQDGEDYSRRLPSLLGHFVGLQRLGLVKIAAYTNIFGPLSSLPNLQALVIQEGEWISEQPIIVNPADVTKFTRLEFQAPSTWRLTFDLQALTHL